MSLCVYANGSGDGEDTYVSCYIMFNVRRYVDILEWPFQGEVTVELLNQLEGKNHYKDTIEFDESTLRKCNERVVGKQYGTGWGDVLSLYLTLNLVIIPLSTVNISKMIFSTLESV